MITDSERRVARDAAVQSLVSNVVYLAVMIGFTVAIAKRDWVTRQAARARQAVRQEWRQHAASAALAGLRREISEWEHRDDRTAPPDRRPAPQPGGLYRRPPPGGPDAARDTAERG